MEYSEPSFRGVMIAYSNVSGTLGMLLVFVLNTMMPWRMVALICLFVPILTVVALYFVSVCVLKKKSKNNIKIFNKSFWAGSRDTSVVIIKEPNH